MLIAPGGPGTEPVSAQESEPEPESDPETDPDVDDELSGASKFVPVAPRRVLDTRTSSDFARIWNRTSLSFDPVTDTGVAAAAGVEPDDITAVVVNNTLVKAGGGGFATVWPTGSERPLTATNNILFKGHNIGNLVIAPLGLERKISVYADRNTDVTVDVLGVFVRSDESTDGRFVQLGPIRHTDTRDTTPLAAGETRTFDLTTAGVPVDAVGVSMNVTAFRSNGKGFHRIWASGTPAPNTANINVLEEGYRAGNQVISGLTDGKVDVFTDVGSDLTIDITGYFTGSAGAASTDGLFVPIAPRRFLDSRRPSDEDGLTGGSRLIAGESFRLPVAGRFTVPTVGVEAVAFNITGVQAGSQGFVKAYPTGSTVPATSSLNFTGAGQTVPNHAITAIDPTTGSVELLPSVNTHLTVDATGYFLNDVGVVPPAMTATKTVDPGTFVPAKLPGAPAPGPYDFLQAQREFFITGERKEPVLDFAYDACAPIRYALNVDLANDEQIADLITSIEAVEAASGVDFQFAGVTSAGMNIDSEIIEPENPRLFDEPLPYRYLPPGADIVIGYSNSADSALLQGAVVGVGGGLPILAGDQFRYIRGFAIIDLADLPTTGTRLATTTHELGHLMGLAHVYDHVPGTFPQVPSTLFQGLDPQSGTWSTEVMRAQLMYPFLNAVDPINQFDAGDLNGLFQLYGTQGSCGGADNALISNSQPTPPDDFHQLRLGVRHLSRSASARRRTRAFSRW